MKLYDELDFVMDPVLAGLCSYESVRDGTVSLMDLAIMNDALEAKRENERRARKASETK